MQKLAKELSVVVTVSFLEEVNNAHYNSNAIIDTVGTDVGLIGSPIILMDHVSQVWSWKEFDLLLLTLFLNFRLSREVYFNPGYPSFKVVLTKSETFFLFYHMLLGNMINYIITEVLVQCFIQVYVEINGFPRQQALWFYRVPKYCFIPLPLSPNLNTRDWIHE